MYRDVKSSYGSRKVINECISSCRKPNDFYLLISPIVIRKYFLPRELAKLIVMVY